jgi:hypothetical protein
MSVGKRFINCKKNGCRIDLGFDNPIKVESMYLKERRLSLKVTCPTCKNENYYDLRTDLNAL